ncbi:MAG TPA: hypothetical protein VFI53_21450, partial [Myxococcaceae bacterium]|nr:hypothetical protein [Myxococcaceae bacterium]
GAEKGDDLVGTDPRAGGESHWEASFADVSVRLQQEPALDREPGSGNFLLPAFVRLRIGSFEGASMSETPSREGEFFPRGAIAFFVLMVAFFSVVWLFFYVLMIRRN